MGCATFLACSAVVCRSKMQTQTALSSTKAEFHATASAAKMAQCLCLTIAGSQSTQAGPTATHENNQLTKTIVDVIAPTEQMRHVSILHFDIMDWKTEGSIDVSCMPGKLDLSKSLAKPSGWVWRDQHACCPMGCFTGIDFSTDDILQSSDSRLGKGAGGTDTLIGHVTPMWTHTIFGVLSKCSLRW